MIVCVCYLTWHDYPSLVEGESRRILLLLLQFDLCSNCYILVCWLFTYWEIYEMQYYQVVLISSEIQIGQLLFNCSSSGFKNDSVYVKWHVSSSRCCSVVLSLHLSLRAVGVVRHGCHEVLLSRAAFHLAQVTAIWSRSSNAPQPLLGAVASTLWTVGIIALIIYYILHRCLILSSLSQVLRINQCLCIVILFHCYNYVYIPW